VVQRFKERMIGKKEKLTHRDNAFAKRPVRTSGVPTISDRGKEKAWMRYLLDF